MKKLLIVGAGGFGREVACWAAEAMGRGTDWVPAGFLDDNVRALEGTGAGLPRVGGVSDFVPTDDVVLVVAVGLPGIRRRLQEDLAKRGACFASVIHPTAVVAPTARLGAGTVLAPYSVVSADVRVGDGVVLNFHAVAEHDVRLGRWSQLNSHANACGYAVLGEEVLVGTHGVIPPRAQVPDGVSIERGSVFGV
jgi:sugar O-acyltransferase (sialic acid O-acetyltransferase NeuD family)